jgi:hypothetical protein
VQAAPGYFPDQRPSPAHRPGHRPAPRHQHHQGYKAVYPEGAIRAHLAFLARRRALRPTEEYRAPTDAEWDEFLSLERRKVSTGTTRRARLGSR